MSAIGGWGPRINSKVGARKLRLPNGQVTLDFCLFFSAATAYYRRMRCFTLSHAGVVLEHQGASLFIDVGTFTSPDELAAALFHSPPPVGLVVTHEHPDHWLAEHLADIQARSPECPVFTTASAAKALRAAGIPNVQANRPGEVVSLGPFNLEFYGGAHQAIHSTIPAVDNLGVLVNDTFAYGGDSLTLPPLEPDVLGVPIGSPWATLGDVLDFVLSARPRRAYLTHDGLLSTVGRDFYSNHVSRALGTYGGELLDTPVPRDGAVFRLDV